MTVCVHNIPIAPLGFFFSTLARTRATCTRLVAHSGGGGGGGDDGCGGKMGGTEPDRKHSPCNLPLGLQRAADVSA